MPTKQLYQEKVLFVKNVALEAGEEELKEVFKEKGEVVSVRMPRAGAAHKGYAYVEFAEDAAVKACLAESFSLKGQDLSLSRSIPMKDHRHTTAATRKDLPQRVNQRLIVQGKLDREDPAPRPLRQRCFCSKVRQSAMCPTTVYAP